MFLFRTSFFIKSFPRRVLRLLRHILLDNLGVEQSFKLKLIKYLPGIGFLLMDVFAIPELYDYFTNVLKQSSRYLTEEEKSCAEPIFGSIIPLDEVRLDSRARIGPSQLKVVYVSFFTINSHGAYGFSTFIHELVHVWQYMTFGSIYILHALIAQRSLLGYNYGGLAALHKAKAQNKGLLYFNFEQQADIVRDYFLIINGYRPQWSDASIEDVALYEYFIEDLERGFWSTDF